MPRPLAFDPTEALAKATNVFWRQGYEATSLDDLTKAMGINRPSLYNTFGDKCSLYLAALRNYRERNGGLLEEMLERAESVRASLRSVFTLMATTEAAERGCMVVNAAIELAPVLPEVQQLVGEAARVNERVFAEAIRRGQTSGEIDGDKDPEALAKLLYNGMVALRVRARGGAGEEELLENAELTLSLLD